MRQIQNALPIMLTLLIAFASAVTDEFWFAIEGAFAGGALQIQNNTADTGTNGFFDYSSDILVSDIPQTEGNKSSQTASTEQSKDASGSIEASSSGAALGKIVEQFISPYSAKYSYNNVYLKNTSGLSIDLKSELNKKLGIKIKKTSEPEVLIVHTHATECYMYENRDYYTSSDASRTTDNSKNVTRIGDIIESKLKNEGIGVIHDKTQHDYPSYTGSYSRAEVTIKEYLKKYPSIKIVIDVHRDSIALNDTDRVRPVAEVNGKNAAQVMLVMGSESGTVKNFPNWKENFRLAARLQQTMEVMYPGLARPMVLASKLYNQNLTTGSILLEVGTESNLLSEAEYSAELVGNALASLLNTMG